jgi:hypothetical protein
MTNTSTVLIPVGTVHVVVPTVVNDTTVAVPAEF